MSNNAWFALFIIVVHVIVAAILLTTVGLPATIAIYLLNKIGMVAAAYRRGEL